MRNPISTDALDRLKYFNLSVRDSLKKVFDRDEEIVKSAAEFNGSNYLSVAGNSSLAIGSSFSMGAWVRMNDVVTNQSLFHRWDGSGYSLELFGGVFNFVVVAGGLRILTTSAPTVDNWYFLVGTVSNTSTKLYVNGVLVDTDGSGTISNSDESVAVVLGGRSDPPTGQLDGILKSCFKYDRELTDIEVSYLYNSGFPREYADLSAARKVSLVSWWDLSEASGTRADSVGSNNLTSNGSVGSETYTYF